MAVLVNGTYAPGENEELVYTPRSEEQVLEIENLVKSAVGFDEDRGDLVQVSNMQFADLSNLRSPLEENDLLFGFEKTDIMRLAELLVLGVVAALVLLLVVKPLLGRLLESSPAVAGDVDGALADELSGHQALEDKRGLAGNLPALGRAGGTGTALAPAGQGGEFGDLASGLPALTDETDDPNGIEKLIDVQKVEGRVRASSLRKIGEIIEKHPEEAVSILRNWIYQEV